MKTGLGAFSEGHDGCFWRIGNASYFRTIFGGGLFQCVSDWSSVWNVMKKKVGVEFWVGVR